jgi:hypothetical protein
VTREVKPQTMPNANKILKIFGSGQQTTRAHGFKKKAKTGFVTAKCTQIPAPSAP